MNPRTTTYCPPNKTLRFSRSPTRSSVRQLLLLKQQQLRVLALECWRLSSQHGHIVPIWLYHKDNPEHKIRVYALLDNASGGTFIKEQSLKRLGIEGTETKLLLTTVHDTQEIKTKAAEGLVAAHFTENDVHLDMPRAYVRQNIPADRDA